MPELIRQAVERLIDGSKSEEAWQRASALVGRYDSGLGDVAVRHDDYLAKDYEPDSGQSPLPLPPSVLGSG